MEKKYRSGVLNVSIVREDGFRSSPEVNTPDDMVRVTLDMPKLVWRDLQKYIAEKILTCRA